MGVGALNPRRPKARAGLYIKKMKPSPVFTTSQDSTYTLYVLNSWVNESPGGGSQGVPWSLVCTEENRQKSREPAVPAVTGEPRSVCRSHFG